MIDTLFFIYCATLSFTGFAIGFYGIMAKQKIKLETQIGMNNGFDFDTEEGNAYFAQRYENWRAGSYFDSQLAPISGILIALCGAGINLINNSWWTSLILLIVAYILYQIVINILKWKIQIASIVTGIVSVILIIVALL